LAAMGRRGHDVDDGGYGRRCRCPRRHIPEWKIVLIEVNMSGDDDAPSGWVIAAIALGVHGVTHEHAGCRAGCQFMSSSGGQIWITQAPKHA
jgi:hypothetical protein